ncbi:MAG: phosphoglycerate kinase [Candidatus Falkowbacteria bacterium]|nr:phosphoglycerate kinase [Candidatus Falkowbacteria bacterium]
MKIFSVQDNLKKIAGKKVLLRLDLNVPQAKGKITNEYKLRCALPTIKLLRSLGCSVIIITHLAEPKLPLSKPEQKSFSVEPLAKWLAKKLNISIKVLGMNWSAINLAVKKMSDSEVVMFENIRLFKGEIDNSEVLARQLASLAQVYINDAFAVSHRSHTSVDAIKKYLPSFAGPLLSVEVNNLEKARTGKKPFVLIMGGAKLSTKLPLLKKLAPSASVVLTGGGIANTIFKATGLEIGKSLFDKEGAAVYSRAKLANVIAPIDVAVLANNKRLEKNLKDIKPSDNILDIGPKTIKLYAKYIAKAKTVIWNGPMGLFEKKAFAKGNQQIAALVSKATKNKSFTLIGGGETVAALSTKNKFSWISTGGGASLAYLEGKSLPGLSKLIRF